VIINGELLVALISCGAKPMELMMRAPPWGTFILKLPSVAVLAPVLAPFTLSVAPDMGTPVESTIFPVTSCVCALAIHASKRQVNVIDKNFLITVDGLKAIEVSRQLMVGVGGLPKEDVGYPKGWIFGIRGFWRRVVFCGLGVFGGDFLRRVVF